ncbi:MAG TPA: DegQ family serine endoprotease [Methylomirabilota bacterium]|nr:DegQ family serine endoprotease [Methylomirabilota bacterium]
MNKKVKHFSYMLLGGALAVACLQFGPAIAQQKSEPPKVNYSDKPLARDVKSATSFAPVVKKVAPSVVNIFTTKKVTAPNAQQLPDFFRRFFPEGFEGLEDEDGSGGPSGRAPRSRQEQSLGSGVIVSENGYILSNNHVVEGADEVRVVMLSGQEYVAKVVGTDPPTDTAVLKIEATGLPAITMANSDLAEVGDMTLAIGNPFGLGQTVTSGIISAVGRGGFGIVDYEDFIQTDASINPGNSGGALVDAEGRLLGINTFIMSRSGGNQGVGFAIPVNMARSVMDRLIQEGKVRRGYLGVQLQPLSQELAQEFKLPDTKGALVAAVAEDTPAEKAGFQSGDIITQFNGREVSDSRHLRLMVAQTAPNSSVKFNVLRNGKKQTINVTLAELPSDALASNADPRRQGGRATPSEPDSAETLEGVTVTDLTPATRRQFNIPQRVAGALVMRVDPDSNAYAKGIRAGTVIEEINGKPVKSADDAVELTEANKAPRLRLRIWRSGVSQYIVVDKAKE